jgi:hypothetical protein
LDVAPARREPFQNMVWRARHYNKRSSCFERKGAEQGLFARAPKYRELRKQQQPSLRDKTKQNKTKQKPDSSHTRRMQVGSFGLTLARHTPQAWQGGLEHLVGDGVTPIQLTSF